MSNEFTKKIVQQIRNVKCNKKGCLSQQRDSLDVVWYGQQYGQCKQFTCSACYICNEEAIKASFPTHLNVLPLSLFVQKFTQQYKIYEQNKNSKEYYPKVLKEKSKDLQADFQKLQVQLHERLNQLAISLTNFSKKIEEANLKIFKHQIFEQIIAINNEDKFENLLQKIILLIQMLNVGENDACHFQDIEQRSKKLNKVNQHIVEITGRTLQILKQIFQSLRQKNQLISKL